MDEDARKHLEFVQGVVSRMAGNCFLLKGWSVTLAAGLFALAATTSRPTLALLALVPALTFWGLDAYYLRQERLYRALYDEIRKGRDGERGGTEPFAMDTSALAVTVPAWARTLASPTIACLHLAVVLAAVAIALLGTSLGSS